MSTEQAFCKNCLIADKLIPNSPSVSELEEEERISHLSPPLIHFSQPTLKMSECATDTIRKIDRGNLVGDPFPATPMDLTKYFDYPLLSYYSNLSVVSSKEKVLPLVLYKWIDKQKKSTKDHRRSTLYVMPYGQKGCYFYETDFALAAKAELLCRAMNTRKDATAVRASPSYIGRFFALSANREEAPDPESDRDLTFKVEDYVYFELWTCYSFLIEAAAMLTIIPDEEIQSLCKEQLKDNWDVFIPKLFAQLSTEESASEEQSADTQNKPDDKTPPQNQDVKTSTASDVSMSSSSEKSSTASSDPNETESAPFSILARIAYMRYFLYELWSNLERYKVYGRSRIDKPFSVSGIPKEDVQKIVDRIIFSIRTINTDIGVFDLCKPNTSHWELKVEDGKKFLDGEVDNPSKSSKIAKECHYHLCNLIQTITNPIDICKYAGNPIYGPVAFCNPLHLGVSAFLKDLEDADGKSTRPPKNKRWEILKDLQMSLSEYVEYI